MGIGAWVYCIFAAGSLASIALGHPWTVFFARLQNPPEVCQTKLFHETNIALSIGWTFLFIGGAVFSTLGSPALNFLYGGTFGLMGYYSKNIGSWYSSWRTKQKNSL